MSKLNKIVPKNHKLIKTEILLNEIKNQEIESIKTESTDSLEIAKRFEVKNFDDVESATVILKDTKFKMKSISEKMDPICQKANEAHKATTALRSELLQPYKLIDVNLRDKINIFNLAEHKKQQELERKAEAKRQAAEKKEKERLDKLAEKQMERGDFKRAEKTIEKAEDVFIPVQAVDQVQKRVVDDSGKTTSSASIVYQYTITDMDLILNAIIDRKLPQMKEKPKEIALSKAVIKEHVEGLAYGDKLLAEIGLSREEKSQAKIY